MPRFEWPWVLLLLVLVPLLARRTRRAATPALGFNLMHRGLPVSRRAGWLMLPAMLRCAAIALLIVACAGPRLSGRRVREISRTIALQMVVDCSGSMDAPDMQYGGRTMSRIEAVREVSRAFVFGDGVLEGRPDDMIGVVSFAEEPVTLCPLTMAHETLRPVIAGIHIGRNAGGTAIGDAVAVAAARIRQAETAAGEVFKSKAVILITDGENNSGSRSPEEAARLAKQWGVRVYAIGIRTDGGTGGPAVKSLEAMAEVTGGIARMAGGGAALREVYREIDRLERAERHAARFSGGWEWIYGLGVAALLLLAGEVVVSQTWLRRLP